MSAKPFRNSKGVNKPFCSPFNNTPQNNNNKRNTNIPESNSDKTPLKVSVAKRLLFQQTPSPKKLCSSEENSNNQANIKQNNELYQVHLESLKERIQLKEESIKNLKTTLSYQKKNKAEDLENAIKKWTECCQNALKDYQNELQERTGQSVTMSEILSSFNINPDIVCFSVDNDTFQ
ncbi:Swi5-dependent recombination DNA repair protein 1 like protein [Habropoda laboriosa]|uniref:Swi5-dependent recombination DNA repair protein 1 homolog n=1 Tax=Habropoda laboriosa TaxID=597456 RepID=A0A0L7QR62_9HYME|nr:PREDICTED: swi5-dependent recombination DNA repair protein 1 homolog [Habropoda laboriosa]KOC60986.1 Swi5-dependent recombination DNA repair protein 1 like protein [Habropoda laboriosa]